MMSFSTTFSQERNAFSWWSGKGWKLLTGWEDGLVLEVTKWELVVVRKWARKERAGHGTWGTFLDLKTLREDGDNR